MKTEHNFQSQSPRRISFVLGLLIVLAFVLAIPGPLQASKKSAETPVNQPPVPTALTFSLSATFGQSFTYQFPPYLFVDPEGDPMTYSISDVNGADVSWLTFNQSTLTLSASSVGATEFGVGTFQIKVTADDGHSNTASTGSTQIQIFMNDPNTAPVAHPGSIADQVATTSVPFSLTIPTFPDPGAAITDNESNTLKYQLLQNGGALPAWMHFDPWTLQLTGTPDVPDAGTFTLQLRGFDQDGFGQQVNFSLQVKVFGAKNITAVGALSDINVSFGTSFGSISFPSTVLVTLDDASTDNLGVTFFPGSYSPTSAGSQAITGIITTTPTRTNDLNLTATVNVVVAKGNQTITFNPDPMPAKTIADIGTQFTLSGSSTSGLPITYGSTDPTVATVSGTTVTIHGGGATLITANVGGSTNYNPASDSRTLTVTKANQTITFNALSAKKYGDPVFGLTATASSGLAVIYSSSDLNVATISGTQVTIVGVGTTTITAFQLGNPTYNAAPTVDQPLVVNKGDQVITFNAIPDGHVGDPILQLSASSNSGLPVSFVSSDPLVANVVPAFPNYYLNTNQIGTTTITASAGGSALYNAASVDQPYNVLGLSQTITFGPISDKLPSALPFALTATASSSLPVVYTSLSTGVATVSGNVVSIVGTGMATIRASQPGNTSFSPAPNVDQSFNVAKLNQTITFNALPHKLVSDGAFNLTATASSGLTVTYVSSNPSVASISGSTVTPLADGTTNITASQAGNIDYNGASDVIQQLVVGRVGQTITFAALPAKFVTDPPFQLNATASSGLAVSYTSSNPAVASVSGSTVTLHAVGNTNITASQAGNPNFFAATDVVQMLNVVAVDQTINFNAPSDKILGDPAFTLDGVASSGLAVVYTTSSDKISIAGNVVAIQKAGRVSVTATQPGNTSYNAASPVTVSFCIKPATPTISNTPINSSSVKLTSSSTSNNQWFINGGAIAGATDATYTATQTGSYNVQVKADDCQSALSGGFSFVITGDLTVRQTEMKMYPNPVEDVLEVTWPTAAGKSMVVVYEISGKEMDRLTTEESRTTLSIRHYASGPYLLLVKTPDASYQGRFVKK